MGHETSLKLGLGTRSCTVGLNGTRSSQFSNIRKLNLPELCKYINSLTRFLCVQDSVQTTRSTKMVQEAVPRIVQYRATEYIRM